MLIRRGDPLPVPEVAGIIEHTDRLRRLGYEPMPESWTTRAPEDGWFWFIYGLDEEGRPVRYWRLEEEGTDEDPG